MILSILVVSFFRSQPVLALLLATERLDRCLLVNTGIFTKPFKKSAALMFLVVRGHVTLAVDWLDGKIVASRS
jgi:hypothetical protein